MGISELQAVAFEDDLTGLYNRRFVENYLSTQVDWKGTTPTSFILIDIDGFHRANDRFSREEADSMLFSFGKRLEAAARDVDTVARDSGDSFFLILPNLAKDGAVEIARKIVEQLVSEPLQTRKDKMKIDLTASAGVVSIPEDGADPESIRKAAETVLFHAKRTGRGRVSIGGRIDQQVAAEKDLLSGLPCREFCGRKTEVAAAAGLFDDLAAKRTAVLLVQGAAGVGKSRFMKEISAQATERKILYLHAICSESHRQTPGHALIFLIDQYYRSDPEAQAELSAALFPAQRVVAREFIPSFSEWPSEQVNIPPRDRKPLLLSLLETAFTTMAKRTPLLMLLDNAGFADSGTLDILRRVVKAGKTPIAAVLAIKEDARGKEMVKVPELDAFLQEVRKLDALQALSLPPLTRDESTAMIRAVLGDSVPPAFETLLTTRSAGNPLFIEEAIRGLILKKRIVREGSRYSVPEIAPEEVPASLAGLIEQSLSTLSAEAGELVTNAAILGSRFDLQDLQEVLGKREGETLDAVDQVRDLKLIEHLDRGRGDDFAFRSSSAREVRFTTTSEDVRRRLEVRRSSVVRARSVFSQHQAKGPTGIRPAMPVPRVQAPLSSQQPAAIVGRPPRIPEGTAPLAPAAAKAAADFARALTALLRVGRLYPQWSQTSAQFTQQMQAAAQAMVAEAGTVTYSSEPKTGFAINGAAVESARNEAFADLDSAMSQRLIAALTLGQGIEARELEALMVALAAPLNRSRTAADHWDRFLDQQSIRHLDIRQKRYVAMEADNATLISRPKAAASEPPSSQDIEELRGALRSLKASADNLRLYPPGHALVEQAIGDTTRLLTSAVERMKVIDLASSSDGLLINGFPTDARTIGDGGPFLAEQLVRRKLDSLSVRAGLRGEEVQALISALSIPPENDAWKAVLSKAASDGEVHLRFGTLVYTQVGSDARGTVQSGIVSAAPPAGGAAPEGPPVEFDTIDEEPLPPAPAIRADIRARAYLKAPPERFLSEDLEEEIAPLLEVLTSAWMETLSSQLVDRLATFTVDGDAALRAKALRILTRGLRGVKSLRIRTVMIGRMQEILGAEIGAETDPAVLDQIVQSLNHWLDAAMAVSRFQATYDLLTRVHQRLEANTAPPSFGAAVATALGRQSGPGSPLFKALHDPAIRSAALKVAGRFGATMIPSLIEIIAETDDIGTRRLATGALNDIGGTASADLAKEVFPDAPAKRIVRVLGVIERVAPPVLEGPVGVAIAYEHTMVREAVVDLLKRLDKPKRAACLRAVLGATPVETLKVARDLAADDLVLDTIRLLQASGDEKVLRAGCSYIARFPSPQATAALRRILESRPKLFGMVKGFTDETRRMAVLAARGIKHEDARKLVEEARDDKSPEVREAAEGK